MDVNASIIVTLVLSLPYSYALAAIVSRAYFNAKIEYQQTLITKLAEGADNDA